MFRDLHNEIVVDFGHRQFERPGEIVRGLAKVVAKLRGSVQRVSKGSFLDPGALVPVNIKEIRCHENLLGETATPFEKGIFFLSVELWVCH